MKNPFAPFALATAVFAWLAGATPVAWAQTDEDKTEQAIKDLSNAIHAHPKDARLYLARGNAYADFDEDYEAYDDYTKAIRLDPKLTEAYSARADFNLEAQDWNEAIADYSVVIRREPTNAKAYACRAYCYQYRCGCSPGPDLARSIADDSEAIRLNPADAKMHINRAEDYSAMGEYEKAAADCAEAIRVKPPELKDLTRACYYRGYNDFLAGDYGQAATDFTAVLQIDANYPEASEARGRAYAAMGEYAKAIADYNTAIDLSPGAIVPYDGLVRIYEITGEKEKARGMRQKLVDRYSSLNGGSGSYQLLADAYVKLGEFDKAIAVLNSYIALPLMKGETEMDRGLHSMFIEQRGTIYKKKGDTKNAMRDFDEAIMLNPKNSNAHCDRAGVFAAAHDYAREIADYRRAMALDSPWPDEAGDMARFYATCPEKKFRNGAKAEALALEACKFTKWRQIDDIDTLAAAEAQAGKFDDAVKWEEWAIELADAQKGDLRKDDDSMKAMADRLALYEQKKQL